MPILRKKAPHATELAEALTQGALAQFHDAIDQLEEAQELLREAIAEDLAKSQRLQARAAASQDAHAANEGRKKKLADIVG